MFVVIFHMLYFLGKYVYDNYRGRKANTPSNDDTEGETADSRDGFEDNKVEVAQPLPSMELLYTVKFSPPVYIQRYLAVANVLSNPKYDGKLRKIVDFGCSELGFLPYLRNLKGVEEILFIDVDRQVLECNKSKAAPLIIDHLQRQKPFKIEICEGSVTHNDKKLEKTDAVVCIELIEHLYNSVLYDVPNNIFGYIKPKVVIITTPNAEFNVLFSNFHRYRHVDHKFEWTREQFQNWAENIVRKYPYYDVSFKGIGYGPEGTQHLGACSQMAIFEQNQEPYTIKLQSLGVEGLFQTIETYIYPFTTDDRSDTEKLLHEVLYYINFLRHNEEELSNEVDLVKLHTMIRKYSISLDILRDIMCENDYVIEDRANGPVVILPEESDTEMGEICSSGDTDIDDDLFEDENQPMEAYNMNEDMIYDSNDWNEESIVIATSQIASNHENSYLFDGEHLTDLRSSEEEWDADVQATVTHVADVTDISAMISNTEKSIRQEILPSDHDTCTSNTTETNNVVETNGAIATPDITNSSLQVVSQGVSMNLSSVQDNDASSSFQPYMSVSRSSTSPGLLFSSELDDSLISHSLLNSTFHRSETSNEAVAIVNLTAEVPSMNETLFQEEEVEVNLSEHESWDIENSNNMMQNNVDSMKHQVLEETLNDRMIEPEVQNVLSVIYDKPQSTSSPRCNKIRTTHKVDMNQIVPAQGNNHLYHGKHSTVHHSSEKVVSDVNVEFPKCNNEEKPIITIKQSCLEGDDLLSALESYTELIPLETNNTIMSDTDVLKATSKKSWHSDNIIAETINHQTTSNNKNATSKRETHANYSFSNKSQRELCSKSEVIDNGHSTCAGHSIYVFSLREDGNEETAEKENLIKHETDIVNVQRVDTRCVLSSDNVHEEYASCKSKVMEIKATIKPYDDNSEICLYGGSKVFAQPSIRGKSLSPFRELSNIKSWNNGECSSSTCAKENNTSDDSFKSCDEYTNNKIVQFTPLLRGDENVGCDIKDFTSKDVNTSNITGLIAIAEAKLSSPTFETPPDSWSHEIVDSGYLNSASGQDITPENDLSSIAQDHIPDIESPSVAEAPRLGVLEPIEVENGDLANNNRDDEGNNMVAADAANDIEGLQPLIDVLENDLENENDIYVLENGFPIWLLRILDMANPLDFDVQVADVNYMDHDEGFDSSSSDE